MSLLNRSLFIIIGIAVAVLGIAASVNHQPTYEYEWLKWNASCAMLFFMGLAALATGIAGAPNWVGNALAFAGVGCLYLVILSMDGPLVANTIFGSSLAIALTMLAITYREARLRRGPTVLR